MCTELCFMTHEYVNNYLLDYKLSNNIFERIRNFYLNKNQR